MQKVKFDELPLSKEMLKAISDLGFEEATPVQAESIPELLKGRDLIGQAHTGTGKTAAFGIPAIEMLDNSVNTLQVLVLLPTRELAIQVAEDLKKLSKYKKEVSLLPIYGGQSYDHQFKTLKKGVKIVIGTPGRIIDHINRGTLNLENIKLVILDEADEMLSMGFREDLEVILKSTSAKHQTAMFSATMSPQIMKLTKKYFEDPVIVKVVHKVLTVPEIEQLYFEVKEKNKLDALVNTLYVYNLKLSLVFCNTKKSVDELLEHLQAQGFSVDKLHGDVKQSIRERVINKFKSGKIEILIATDVAARGLDVENVEAVFNYDLPQDEEYYVHRIGRTGRAGKKGISITFVTAWEMEKLKNIQKYTKTKIKHSTVPSMDDVEEVKTKLVLEEIKKVIDAGKLTKYTRVIEKLINEDYTSMDIASALLKMKNHGVTLEEGATAKKEFKVSSKEARLFLTLGKKDKMRPGDILGAIAGESGLPGEIVGAIDMFDKYSFVNVPDEYADQIIDSLSGVKMKGRTINIERANKK